MRGTVVRFAILLSGLLAGGPLLACSLPGNSPTAAVTATPSPIPKAIHNIKHVIVIMQENRSFDSYFGTYPGADGIPTTGGAPSVCVPDPQTTQCVKPYVDHADINGGGPHFESNATADIDGGRMDGFIAQARFESVTPDVMGYHTGSDIPNYWAYAKNFVLQDHMFEPNASWSLPAHLFMVSEWSATCYQHNNRTAASTRSMILDFRPKCRLIRATQFTPGRT